MALTQSNYNDADDAQTIVTFGAVKFILLPEGALWWPDESTLIVADLHLEKSSHFAKRGQFLPPYDSQTTLQNLLALAQKTRTQKLIVLGDNFHDATGHARLCDKSRALLGTLSAHCQIFWLSGNHDGKSDELIAPDGTSCMRELRVNQFIFRHAPTQNLDYNIIEICGHLHPAARIKTPHNILRRRVFVKTNQRMFLPAFGSLTGGLNIRDEAFTPYLNQPCNIFALGRDAVFPIAFENCISEGVTLRR